ncbi:YesK family protein [Bacillus sp. SD088]|uniref:YesK family protein n=1 Tax=Bacillus sp. SD088 TaxID=2782012 RepID=UPI001A970485|nr:YesK family protein [Bacillus sp. SD088]MBO0995865.1 LPXTG cell wall anchor domain-containing protein [Bacillus sp. SD088]
MDGISTFSFATAGLALFITIGSFLLFKRKRVLVPIIILLISLALFALSFVIGGWEGMGLGVISLSLLISSFISLVLLMFYEIYRMMKNTRPKE